MQGNFSRRTFDPKKHYIGVLMQQGRVQLDADWNEQQAIQQHRVETEARDLIGPCGTSFDNDGFKIAIESNNVLTIGKGHYYVDGILCENELDGVIFFNQPHKYDTRPAEASPPDILQLFKDHDTLWGILYLDVWQRHVTALDDASIREKALNGPDTATRLQTIWQAGLLPLPLPDDFKTLRQELQTLLHTNMQLEKALKKQPENTDIKSRLRSVKRKIESVYQAIGRASIRLTCHTDDSEWEKRIAPSTGTLNARTLPQQAIDDPCLLPPGAGYQRLDNQLYRVEVHRASENTDNAPPTFKWSRENGSVVTKITNIVDKAIYVHDIGPDEVFGFYKSQDQDQWIEILDDETELLGLPGQLVRIMNVDQDNLIITVSDVPLKPFDAKLNPKIRRWDQAAATKDGIIISNQWIDLEGGIQVQFSQGTYKTGDYWLIPARTATGTIEWPGLDDTPSSPIPQPRLGIVHHYCHLAMLVLSPDTDKPQFSIRDCRERFPPLVSPAMHVIWLNWLNDDTMQLSAFLQNGLGIMLDAEPDPNSVKEATMIVTLEIPFAPAVGVAGVGLLNICRSIFILHGDITVNANVIQWRIPEQEQRQLSATLELLPVPPRIRVILKGHNMWSNQRDERYYLDGQSLGQPALQTDGQTPCISLTLPTGLGAMASDFESWFFLGVRQPVEEPLRVTLVNFIFVGEPNNHETILGTLDLTHVQLNTTTPPPELQQDLQWSQVPSIIEITFSRQVRSDGFGPYGIAAQSIQVMYQVPGQARQQIPGDIDIVNETTVRFLAKDPPDLDNPYPCRLTIFGDKQQGHAVVLAQDTGAALDGDFDGKPGGNFVFPFNVTPYTVQ